MKGGFENTLMYYWRECIIQIWWMYPRYNSSFLNACLGFGGFLIIVELFKVVTSDSVTTHSYELPFELTLVGFRYLLWPKILNGHDKKLYISTFGANSENGNHKEISISESCKSTLANDVSVSRIPCDSTIIFNSRGSLKSQWETKMVKEMFVEWKLFKSSAPMNREKSCWYPACATHCWPWQVLP